MTTGSKLSPHPDPENLTPTETRLLRLLSDGGMYKRDVLMGCIDDPLASSRNLHVHLSNLRKKLLPLNQTICCVLRKRERFYRRMVLYVPSTDTEQDDLLT